mgnify:CR=1 FL=1
MAKITVTYEFDSEDDVRAHFGGLTRAAAPVTVTAPPAAEVTEAATAAALDAIEAARAAEPEVTATVDSDGMPYDAEVHAEPKSFTSAGTWRAKRGKATEADKRRAEFKATGGAVTPPTVAPVAPATMPGLPGGLPGAAPVARAEPVSYEVLFAKYAALSERGLVDAEQMTLWYGEFGIDPTTFGTNESARAAIYGALLRVEAEAA